MTGVQITIFHDFHRGRWFAAYVAPRDCVSVFKREKRCTLRVGRDLSGLALRAVSLLVFSAPRGTFVGKHPVAVTGSTGRTRACACARASSRSRMVDRRRVNSRSASYRDGIGRIQSNSSIRCLVASNHSQPKSREGFMRILI